MASLTVLAFEGPMLRAYLAALSQDGIRPDRVVVIAPRKDAATGRDVGRWLPPAWRPALAARTNDLRINYWPRQIKKQHPALVKAVSQVLSTRFAFFERFMQDLDHAVTWHDWVPNPAVALVDGLSDPALASYLAESELILFTGGGLVPGSLIKLTPGRFLHIHPGYLPHIRGADGMLWSTLVRGRPGRTAFFLAPGLDDGPVVEADEPEPIEIPLATGSSYDTKTLYRTLFAYLDPCLRAEMAVRVLARGNAAVLAAPLSKSPEPGTVFPFMSPLLRTAALDRIFIRQSG